MAELSSTSSQPLGSSGLWLKLDVGLHISEPQEVESEVTDRAGIPTIVESG
jgi:hypothetical protein